MIRRWLSNEFSISKRSLGVLMIVSGVVLAGAMLLVELIGTSAQGIGVIQWIGIVGGISSAALGLTLLPLDDQLA